MTTDTTDKAATSCRENRYCCVHCGAKVVDLYKDFGQGAILLTDCARCGQVADPYVEVDTTYLCLEVFLQKESVYRHILFNNQSTILSQSRLSIVRLLLGLLVFDAYSRWSLVDSDSQFVTGSDVMYYFTSVLVCSAVSMSAYLILLTVLGSKLYNHDAGPVFHASLLSMFGILFNLLLLTWATDLRFRYGIQALVYMSNIIALKVISGRPGYLSPFLLVCFSAVIRYVLLAISWTVLFGSLPKAADVIA